MIELYKKLNRLMYLHFKLKIMQIYITLLRKDIIKSLIRRSCQSNYPICSRTGAVLVILRLFEKSSVMNWIWSLTNGIRQPNYFYKTFEQQQMRCSGSGVNTPDYGPRGRRVETGVWDSPVTFRISHFLCEYWLNIERDKFKLQVSPVDVK